MARLRTGSEPHGARYRIAGPLPAMNTPRSGVTTSIRTQVKLPDAAQR